MTGPFSVMRRLVKDARGNALVEFALSFPVMLLVTLMIFDIGRALFVYTSVNNLAAEGVRFASVHGSASPAPRSATEVETFVISRAAGLEPSLVNVAVVYDESAATGAAVEITVTYNLDLFLNPVFDFANITLEGNSRMTML